MNSIVENLEQPDLGLQNLNLEQDPEKMWEIGRGYAALVAFYHSPIYRLYASWLPEKKIDFLVKEAVKYLEKAAQQNHALAHHYLGHIYQYALGVKIDFKKSIYYYEQALVNGYTPSLQRLGHLAQYGLGMPKNLAYAIRCYNRISQYLCLQTKTSEILVNPLTANLEDLLPHHKDPKLNEAIIYFTQQVENCTALALTKLGKLHRAGTGVPRDLNQALSYFLQAASLNDSEAQYILGDLYQYGEGVTIDLTKSMHFYRQAAEQQHIAAQINLANFYHHGIGVKQDFVKAKYYYELAALLGDATAQVYLGIFYQNGLGIHADLSKAQFFFQKAAEQNHPLAMQYLADFYQQENNSEENKKLAKKLLRQAERSIN